MRTKHDYFARLVEHLKSLPAVESAVFNAGSASVLICHDQQLGLDLKGVAQESGLFEFGNTEHSHPPKALSRRVEESLGAVDSGLKLLTGGDVDLRFAIFIALLLLAARQVSREHIWAPAFTLFWYALNLVLPPKK